MNVWKIIVQADDYSGRPQEYSYFGVASTVKVAINQTLRLAKKQELGTYIKVASVECLGELDFSTK